MEATLLLALTAGMLGAVNPCGFAMLPAYLSLLVAGATDTRGAVRRALTAAAALTVGYVVVFGAFGLALAPVAGWLRPRLPWFTVGLGLLLVLLGCWLLAGRRLPTLRPLARAPRLTRSWPSMVLFGMAYAVASLGCAIAPFLAIVVTSLRAGTLPRGLALFGAYALGMGLVVAVAALGVALLRGEVVARLRNAGAWVPRLSGLVLLLAGGYVAWYGWYEARLFAGHRAALTDPVILTAARVQRWLAATLDTAGPTTLALLLTTLTALTLLTRPRHPHPPDLRDLALSASTKVANADVSATTSARSTQRSRRGGAGARGRGRG
ncbi:cytochrome c biogenesis CcdA family protein [Micromonospora maris]|uniref:Cytochrome C biogenesis protein n=1 Tax=Micromonospora maris TaxID=1003110 RepID=A0A9X0LD82_9ACTN|nr:cytochrome c biogenesis protein CcdA [Micromonospora maris]AEB46652.1 cytochrome c biogenesis protein transmembrane region [Micromonospora maris AB-18-032]KUJ45849.1 cytochrome C biogenesis protein [Micromonospora maris]